MQQTLNETPAIEDQGINYLQSQIAEFQRLLPPPEPVAEVVIKTSKLVGS